MEKAELLAKLKKAGVLKSKKIIEAFEKVPREKFIPEKYKGLAYEDIPLPIGYGQTISQPTTIAIMLEALKVRKKDKVLEVGSGLGYLAALLAEIAKEGKVVSIEIIPELWKRAKENLRNYKNVVCVLGDGSNGFEKEAPYDRIVVSAAAKRIPKALIEQLKVKGRMVIPVGDLECQKMYLIERLGKDEIKKSSLGYFVFVPLIEK